MNKRKGVDTFADRNSPSIVYTFISINVKPRIRQPTIDRTIIESFGSGVISCSPETIVGMGALSAVTFGIEDASSALLVRRNDGRRLLKETLPSARRTADGGGCSLSSGVPNEREGRTSGGFAIERTCQLLKRNEQV